MTHQGTVHDGPGRISGRCGFGELDLHPDPVAMSRYSFDETRDIRRILKRRSQLLDGQR